MTYTRLPQPLSVTEGDLLRGLLSSLPPGGINKEEESVTYKMMQVIASEFNDVIVKAQEMQDALTPGLTSGQPLRDWEEIAVDEKCFDVTGLTEEQRRALVVASLRGGIPNLTPAALKARLDAEFTPTFTVAETFPSRYDLPFQYNLDYTFVYSTTTLTVTYSRTGLTNATVELIRCFIMAILPTEIKVTINAEA